MRVILGLIFLFVTLSNALAQSYQVLYSREGVGNLDRFEFALQRFSEHCTQHDITYSQHEIALNYLGRPQKTVVYLATFSQWQSASARSEVVFELDTAVKESFTIRQLGEELFIVGKDESGLIYAVQSFFDNELFRNKGDFQFSDAPEMSVRGTAIGLQKTEYLPGRDVYEYPYTEEQFPWFYDKNHWLDYLDMLVENRYNTLYLWNGHPFSSLVKLTDYPYALEVTEETFRKNEEIYTFLTTEANRRGIWVIQMFYNILLPQPFAEKHGLKTQERNRVITPLIEDYTRKSIAAFVEKYPNVGLLVTLGEAMEGVGQDDIDWFTTTIIPGVKEGLTRGRNTEEPPIILRAHDTDAPAVMRAALPHYKNLYTMAKYNGEALTTYTPRGKWAELHRSLSNIGTVHIQNVHILANLEPFRYSSPDFIQKSVQAMHDVYRSKGIHIYPQASYWDWPYTADNAEGRLLQIDRDWMWYKAWARYGWKHQRSRSTEEAYWTKELSVAYGISMHDAQKLLFAMEEVGEISPKILRRFGITDGNRQTSSLGMLMTQLINPYRYGLFPLLYESEAPEGEMIIEYVEKEFKRENHHGETPLQVAEEIVVHGERAVELATQISTVTKNVDEFERLFNDIKIHKALAEHYSYKVKAAIQLLSFKYSKDISSLRAALPDFEKSVCAYEELTRLTKDAYLYANSMQTKQRKIPMRGVDATFKHWKDMLPVFRTELDNFKSSIDSLLEIGHVATSETRVLENADVTFQDSVELVSLKKGANLYQDQVLVVTHLAPELEGLNGIKIDSERQKLEGTTLRFSHARPIKVLVGYFNSEDRVFAPKPVLEIDASANDFGQAEAKVRHALRVQYMPMLDIHTYSFTSGDSELKLPKGEALILGIVYDEELQSPYNADVDNQGDDLDDLFGFFEGTKL